MLVASLTLVLAPRAERVRSEDLSRFREEGLYGTLTAIVRTSEALQSQPRFAKKKGAVCTAPFLTYC